jgi:hypothetical protein
MGLETRIRRFISGLVHLPMEHQVYRFMGCDCHIEIRVLPGKNLYRKWNSPRLRGSNGVS